MFNVFNIGEWPYPTVIAHLRFYQEQTEEGLKDIPFAVWECKSFSTSKIYSNTSIGTLW